MYRRKLSRRQREAIAARQGVRCAICRELLATSFDIDHTHALVHGGSNDDDNLRALCVPCHRRKTHRDILDRDKITRIRAGGRKRKGPPMAGSRDSRWKRRMNGTLERRK